jgi:Clostripain family
MAAMKLGSTPRKVLSYLDHSDPRLAKTKGLHFEAQERQLEDRADISSVGRVFKDGDATPPMDPTLAIVGGVLGLGAAVVSAFAPLGLLALTLPIAAFFIKSSASQAKEMIAQKKFDKSNLNFQGSRTWQLQGNDTSKGHIDSPLLQEDPQAQPSKKDFQEFIDQHMEPGKDNVLVLNGHGTPGVQARVGGFPIHDVSRVLTKKHQETGLKTGLIVLDSCQLGNLSVLKALEGCTDFLVASEADIDVAVHRNPNQSFSPYPTLNKASGDNRELAQNVVREAKGVSTIAAYDMEQLPQLFEDLSKLGTLLTHSNDRKAVTRMLDEARDKTKVSTQSRSTPRVIDLGAFCEIVRKRSQNAETKMQAAAVLKQMNSVVTEKKTSGKFFESSHITFENPTRMNQRDRNALVMSKLPDGWKDFLRSQITQKPGG